MYALNILSFFCLPILFFIQSFHVLFIVIRVRAFLWVIYLAIDRCVPSFFVAIVSRFVELSVVISVLLVSTLRLKMCMVLVIVVRFGTSSVRKSISSAYIIYFLDMFVGSFGIASLRYMQNKIGLRMLP